MQMNVKPINYRYYILCPIELTIHRLSEQFKREKYI